MSGKQTMNWNGEADAKLLIAILKNSDVKVDLDGIAKQLTTDTTTCTPRAVQEHLKKLRKIAQGNADPSSPAKSTIASSKASSSHTPAKTPRKRAATPANGVKKPRKPAAGGKGKKGKAATVVDDADDSSVKPEAGSDEEDSYTPSSKKRKYDDTADNGSSTIGSDFEDETAA